MKTVIEMAQEAGLFEIIGFDKQRLERFAALVREDEREKQQDAVARVDGYYSIDANLPLGTLLYAAPPSTQQKPVAWYLDTFDEDGELEDREYNGINEFSCGRGNGIPLYTTPPTIEAAVLAERERIAAHFDLMSSREMFGGTVADEIRENEW